MTSKGVGPGKFAWVWMVLLLVSAPQCWAELYIYRAPNGERVVTDRPIQLDGYELEHSRLNATGAGRALRYQDSPANRQRIEQHIRTAADLYQLEEALIRAVIRQESNFRLNAVSSKGAQGLMQLMPGTARMYQVSDPFDARQNIHAGTRHLRYLLQRYRNDLDLALAAYNAGETAVARYRGIPPYPETQDYVQAVKQWYREYR